jgi:UDP-2-acetamido-3-amino-2,3-dideoxy-glucuronate N-acetyltransferase
VRHPGAREYADASVLLADPSIDAIVVATPATTHAPLAIGALEEGKHVFVEKPMARSLAEALRMRETARRTGRRLMVGHLLLYHPAVAKLRQLVQSGALGDVQHASAERLGPPPSLVGENAWWSLAPHDVSLLQHLLESRVRHVSALNHEYPSGAALVEAHLAMSSGLSSSVFVSTVHERKIRRVRVVGTRRTAVFEDGPDGPRLVLSASHVETNVSFQPEEPLVREMRHFATSVQYGSPVPSDDAEGCEVVAVLEAGEASMAAGGESVGVAPVHGSAPAFLYQEASS